MKFRHLLAGLTALSLVASAQATNILTENFDSFTSMLSNGWVVKNNSDIPAKIPGTQSILSWDQGSPANFNSQAGADNSYAGVNFVTTNGNVIDNWLFTPVFKISAGEVVTFYTRSAFLPSFPDNLQVSLSSKGASTNTSDFVLQFEVNPALDADGYPSDWTQYQITIPASAGEGTGRLAFRYFLADASVSGNYIGIDSLNVVPEPATVMTLSIGMLALLAMRRRNSAANK